MKLASSGPPAGDEQDSAPLPQGWKCFLSPQGRRYYVNTSSNETTWECPAGAPAAQKSPLKSKSSTGNGHHPTGSSLFQQDKCSMAPQKTSTKREVGQIKSQCVFHILLSFRLKWGRA
ncbi:growth arrest-specific protein 7-like [Anguilla anguilla]|uniref:growth arrest-specific protein 7-like n=1 Tax=Anguilla anguilla TaxID=7936 RepID=UPI0015A7E2D4|nr:growth arrest-specific protein 7-like [Anguilla anguilla]